MQVLGSIIQHTAQEANDDDDTVLFQANKLKVGGEEVGLNAQTATQVFRLTGPLELWSGQRHLMTRMFEGIDTVKCLG